MTSSSTVTGHNAPAVDRAPRPAPHQRLSRFWREVLAVVLGSSVLAAIMTWPTLRNPTQTIEHNLGDPTLYAWQLAWARHSLFTDPANLWNGNNFYPEPLTFAFSDTLLGYWWVNLVGNGPGAAVLTVNLVYVLATAMATAGGYALARQLGASWLGATAAGVAVAYAPWRLIHAGHLHIISTGGIMLAMAMLARGHGWSLRRGYQPERASLGWVVGGWLVACWQITLGFGIGVPFGYALAFIGVGSLIGWLRAGRPKLARRILWGDVGGGIGFAAVVGLMALPYLRMIELFPYGRRSSAELAFYSPPLRGFFIGPDESRIWGDIHTSWRGSLPVAAEMGLLPGYVLYALAAVGVILSVWTLRQRLLLAAATVATIILAMGTNGPFGGRLGYLFLYKFLPGFDAIRTPGRLVIWTTLLLALLAAGTVTWLHERAQSRVPARSVPRRWLPAAVAVLGTMLVLVEGLSALPHAKVPPAPAALRSEHADQVLAPYFVLPSDQGTDQLVMMWSTDGFPRTVNGSSGLTPVSLTEMRAGTASFPDAESVALLRRYGVKTVVVLRDRIEGTQWEDAADRPVDGLGISRREIENAVVYDLG